MKFNVPERLALIELMPDKADYSGIKEVYRTRMLLNLTGEEAQEIKVEHTRDGMIQFDIDLALGLIVDIPMGEWMTNKFREILREKSDNKDLTMAEIALYEKLILDYE